MATSRIERMLNEVRVSSYGKLLLLTVAAAVAGVIIAATNLMSGELSAGVTEAPPSRVSDTAYFPSQYPNKATEASEHIQAF